MGAVISAIGRGINIIISAIANVLEALVSAIVAVRKKSFHLADSTANDFPQILVAIVDLFEYVLCCRCFGSRSSESRIQRRRGRVAAESATQA
ncbi:hypothetical protein C8F04DRAFT_54625 [Mycena alexandri]|uniref:Uncharacterized protein n=1 Tax=Mycena alexandri TaxID=1745969 RepID=A0AAD6XCB8_9AGAR|nr:hypothetical protein C8F04DRAFT_54625 [Mycena alexandri]